jgi:hypothetical protein
MRKPAPDILMQDQQSERETDRPRALRRWAKLCAIVTGATLALAWLGGVALAAGHDPGGSDRVAFDPGGVHSHDVVLIVGTSASSTGDQVMGNGESHPNGNGQPHSNGNSGSHSNSSADRHPSNGARGTSGSAEASHNEPSPPTSRSESHDDNGLHLGQSFHDGISDSQAQAILDAMGGGGGLTVDDVKEMSLGELLETAHAAGVTTEQVGDLLSQP